MQKLEDEIKDFFEYQKEIEKYLISNDIKFKKEFEICDYYTGRIYKNDDKKVFYYIKDKLIIINNHNRYIQLFNIKDYEKKYYGIFYNYDSVEELFRKNSFKEFIQNKLF